MVFGKVILHRQYERLTQRAEEVTFQNTVILYSFPIQFAIAYE